MFGSVLNSTNDPKSTAFCVVRARKKNHVLAPLEIPSFKLFENFTDELWVDWWRLGLAHTGGETASQQLHVLIVTGSQLPLWVFWVLSVDRTLGSHFVQRSDCFLFHATVAGGMIFGRISAQAVEGGALPQRQNMPPIKSSEFVLTALRKDIWNWASLSNEDIVWQQNRISDANMTNSSHTGTIFTQHSDNSSVFCCTKTQWLTDNLKPNEPNNAICRVNNVANSFHIGCPLTWHCTCTASADKTPTVTTWGAPPQFSTNSTWSHCRELPWLKPWLKHQRKTHSKQLFQEQWSTAQLIESIDTQTKHMRVMERMFVFPKSIPQNVFCNTVNSIIVQQTFWFLLVSVSLSPTHMVIPTALVAVCYLFAASHGQCLFWLFGVVFLRVEQFCWNGDEGSFLFVSLVNPRLSVTVVQMHLAGPAVQLT